MNKLKEYCPKGNLCFNSQRNRRVFRQRRWRHFGLRLELAPRECENRLLRGNQHLQHTKGARALLEKLPETDYKKRADARVHLHRLQKDLPSGNFPVDQTHPGRQAQIQRGHPPRTRQRTKWTAKAPLRQQRRKGHNSVRSSLASS